MEVDLDHAPPEIAPTVELPAVELIGAVSRMDGHTLIDEVSLAVPCGRILTVTGLDGSGKSALLNLMSTLVRPAAGRVRLFGKDTEAVGEEGRRALRLDIGVVFEEGGLLDGFTVGENIELPLARRGLPRAELANRAEHWLAELQMAAYRDYLPSQLSMGLTRRAALARALATEPRLLICDEVTAGMDMPAILAFSRLFRRLKIQKGTTIVLAVSDLAVIRRVADAVAVLDGGRLVFHGNLAHLTARRCHDPVLHDLFDDETWSIIFSSGPS